MKIYFDTEFTDLRHGKFQPGLISLGMVTENGNEFYAELNDTWDEVMCSEFVLNAVLPHLQYSISKNEAAPDFVMGIDDLASKLKTWIESTNKPVTLFCDSIAYDWMWIGEIFNGRQWPKNLKRECRSTLAFESDRERFAYNAAEADYWRTQQELGAVRHHALWDARSIKYAHHYAMSKRRY